MRRLLREYVFDNPVYQREMRARRMRALSRGVAVAGGLSLAAALLLALPGYWDRSDWFDRDYQLLMVLIGWAATGPATLLVVPGAVAAALGRERSQRTLDQLLVTPLSTWEIITGKTSAVLGTWLSVLVPALVVATAAGSTAGAVDGQFRRPDEAGVSWFSLWVSLVPRLLVLAGVGAVAGVVARRPGDAVALAYGLAFALWAALQALFMLLPGAGSLLDAPGPPWHWWSFVLEGAKWLGVAALGVVAFIQAEDRLRREASRA